MSEFDDMTKVSPEQESAGGSMPAFLSKSQPTDIDTAAPVEENTIEVPLAHDEAGAEDATGPSALDQAAGAVGSFFAEGFAGVKEMSAAHRAHAEARDELQRLENTIRDREQELEHRRDIEARYGSILDAEAARKTEAENAKAAAEAERECLAAQAKELKAKLDEMKEADATIERRLKSALDAAEDKEKSARESGKRLQRRLDDATKNLDRARKEQEEGVAAAERAIKSAQALITTLTDELNDLKRTPSANPAEYSVRTGELEGEISRANAELQRAQADLPFIQRETQTAIDAAVAAVAEAEKPIAPARESFNAVAAEADKARDAHAAARDEAEARQKELRKQISELEKAAKEQSKAAEKAQSEADAAQAAIDEANVIHAHPEATEALAHALEADRAERMDRVADVEQLAAAEADVRTRTRGSRMKLMVFFAGVVLCIILMLAWFFVAK